MFESLSAKLQNIFYKLKTHGRLNEKQVEEALREIKLALLEADVNFKVVKDLIAKIKERAVGTEVMKSLAPGQQVIKIVNEELTELMGGVPSKITFASKSPTIYMLVGLQGSGKTTSAAKLASYLKNMGKIPFLVAADIYRPAAIDQLESLSKELGVLVYSDKKSRKCEEIARSGIKQGIAQGSDVIIIDTAGRLHIDDGMMEELKTVKKTVRPHQILLVVDAMTGQDAVNIAVSFQEKIDFDGLILTKLDGDARGGAALSIRAVTGKPIKFVSLGEKLDSLQTFYPDRMASRILGMGDVLTLIEKAETTFNEEEAASLAEKIRKQEFTLDDFLSQIQQIKNMGSFDQVLSMLPKSPGLPKNALSGLNEKQIKKVEAIIKSMTLDERRNPKIMSGSRRLRVANGSGTNTREVNRLLKQFNETKKMMKQFSNFGSRAKIGKKILPFFNV
ncbi:signal recognition particle protein [Candidatus Oleimmundimicrobium sp.]|uniref:signal recognition particle protein n=1 Tax=Candidatus Oleimmundimicrobium sp. TaxID=3060597 RepID=UPI00272459FD|nr:signal recognition particle protein [Candidatus Oleimmundimicrobium sp.]MDO8885361.1 signal recognition particle protein [Candidatus Oleimmundimicrobium sp.]